MATLDELQQQLAELQAKVNAITSPPEDYYTSRYSGEELDNIADNANKWAETDKLVRQLPGQNLLDNPYFGNPVDQRQGRVVVPNTTYYSDNQLTTAAGTTSAYVTACRYATGTASGVNYASFKLTDSDTAPTYYAAPENVVRGYIPRWNEYTMDRWNVEVDAAGGLIILIEDDGIVLKNVTEKHLQFKQILPEDIQINGNTCNISVLVNQVESGSVSVALSQISSPWINSIVTESITTGGMYSATGICLQQQQKIIVSMSPNTTVKIKAIKLELGTHQTLAHQDDNGVWQLNEIPDYGEQLARCQRYRVEYGLYAQWGVIDIQTDYIDFSIYLPVTMRAFPSIEGASNLNVNGYSDFAFHVAAFNGNNLRIRATKSNHGLTNAYLESSNKIAFVAEL